MSSERKEIESGLVELDSFEFTGTGTEAFEGNGEAIIISGGATVSINGGAFITCYASNGGAISLEAGSLSLYSFNFTYNKADGNGGAIYVNSGALDLDFGYFNGNGADAGLGGAIYAAGNSSTLRISRTDFQGNHATAGGALYLDGISSCEIIDSGFLTVGDSIYVNGATSVVFSGENAINASVTVSGGNANGAVRVADNAKLIFGNTGAISFDGALGANNTIELNNGDMVTLTNGVQSDTAIIVNSGSDYTLVGDSVNVLKASGLTADTEVTYKGVTKAISAQEGLAFDATDSILQAAVTFYGSVASQTVHGIGFAESEAVYSESFDEVIAGGYKEVVGDSGDELGESDPGKYIINGDIFAANNAFSMSNLTYGGHIYGGDKVESAPEEANPCALTLDNIALSSTKVLKVTGEGRICAESEVTSGGSELQIGFVGTKKAGTVYGGAEILSTGITYNAGEISTTVNGGNFGKIVGNGSTGNYGGLINQSASTLTINDGTFYGRVYAGGYASSDAANEEAAMSVSEIVGNVYLYINGGHFMNYVYGGSCAQYDYLADHNTHITGDVTVTIDSSEKSVKFDTALFAGSQSEGAISGNTKVIFTGSGENLDFSGCTDGIGRIYGGSQNEMDYASVSHDDYLKCVSGDRSLEFNNFSGTMHADFFNFDTVTFTGSSVTLDVYTDLHLVDTWNFDVSSGMVNLNWTATDAENNFAGDTINLNGWNGGTCTFMTGSDAALDGFDKASVKVYNGAGVLVTSGYNVSRVNNTLQIAVA